MNIPTEYQAFYEFLVENDALDNFLNNKHTVTVSSYLRPIDGFLCWDSTKEGYAYWSRLNSQFKASSPISLSVFLVYLPELQQLSPYEYW